jgi:asparagine synthase (glutamine-hydrolysing)
MDSVRDIAPIHLSLLSATQWELAYRSNSILVVHHPLNQRSRSIHRLANSRGVIVGSLYQRQNGLSRSHSVADLSDAETTRIVDSAGKFLVENYWGAYIAIVANGYSNSCNILRDPTASLACYHATRGNVHVFFSDMEDFTRYIQMPTSVNWPYIAAYLLGGLTLSRQCALNEIEDVPGGECITLSPGREARTVLWHPSQFCVENGLGDERTAGAALRSTVFNVIHTLASEHRDIFVLLSGGLDSSILTCCLSQAKEGPNVTCLNFYIPTSEADLSTCQYVPGLSQANLTKLRRIAGNADERIFARSVAKTCGFKLIERERPVATLDFSRMDNAPLAPRPTCYGFILDEDDAECECAATSRATACFTGQGGDSIFYATLRAIPALDYAFLHPFGSRLFQEIFTTASLSRESVPQVLGKVIKHGFLRAPLPAPLERMKRPHLLKDGVVQSVAAGYFVHPWIERTAHLCPGKQYHISGVATSVPLYHHIFCRERIAPSVHPFASQPVVETCLRIPTYVLLAGGVSRGLARRAFQDLLPPDVFRRIAKGSGTPFNQKVVRHNMSAIRERLVAGLLVRNGLLDRHKLETYLTNEQPFLTVQAEQIIQYVACEAWLNQLAPMK